MSCFIVLAFVLISAAFVPAAQQNDGTAPGTADSRWNPWIGTWRLVSDTVPAPEGDAKKKFLLEISPRGESGAVFMKAIEGNTVLFEDAIRADGRSRTLKEENCTGSFSYAWSDTGERLLFNSEMGCPDQAPRKISGLSIINRKGEWLDIQLIQNQDARIITIRRYEKLDANAVAMNTGARNAHASLPFSGSNLSLDEVIELSRKVPSETLEAALMEYRAPYKINAKTLLRLADAEVPDHVIDLMVALSFPDEFVIEQDATSPIAKVNTRQKDKAYSIPMRVNYAIIDPYFPWCWGPSTYSLYWNYGWSVWPGYYYAVPPVWIGPPARRGSGVLVAGEGYTKVRPVNGSFAQPRYAQERAGSVSSSSRAGSRSSGSTYSGGGGSYSTGGGGSYAGAASSAGSASASSSGGASSSSGSSGGSSGSSGGGSGYSGGGSPSASPGGYSSGGGGRGSAVAR